MKPKIIKILVAVLMAVLFASSAAALDFNAEFIEREGGVERKGKIYVTTDKSRFEMEGMEEVEVARADKKVIWLIFPKRRVYVEEEFNGIIPSEVDVTVQRESGDLSREDLGYETVDSYRLKKYLVTVKYNKGETQDKYYEWYRSGFPLPVKMESLNGAVSYEYTKIKMTLQDPNLFNEPKRYKKITADELEKLEAKWAEEEKSHKKKH